MSGWNRRGPPRVSAAGPHDSAWRNRVFDLTGDDVDIDGMPELEPTAVQLAQIRQDYRDALARDIAARTATDTPFHRLLIARLRRADDAIAFHNEFPDIIGDRSEWRLDEAARIHDQYDIVQGAAPPDLRQMLSNANSERISRASITRAHGGTPDTGSSGLFGRPGPMEPVGGTIQNPVYDWETRTSRAPRVQADMQDEGMGGSSDEIRDFRDAERRLADARELYGDGSLDDAHIRDIARDLEERRRGLLRRGMIADDEKQQGRIEEEKEREVKSDDHRRVPDENAPGRMPHIMQMANNMGLPLESVDGLVDFSRRALGMGIRSVVTGLLMQQQGRGGMHHMNVLRMLALAITDMSVNMIFAGAGTLQERVIGVVEGVGEALRVVEENGVGAFAGAAAGAIADQGVGQLVRLAVPLAVAAGGGPVVPFGGPMVPLGGPPPPPPPPGGGGLVDMMIDGIGAGLGMNKWHALALYGVGAVSLMINNKYNITGHKPSVDYRGSKQFSGPVLNQTAEAEAIKKDLLLFFSAMDESLKGSVADIMSDPDDMTGKSPAVVRAIRDIQESISRLITVDSPTINRDIHEYVRGVYGEAMASGYGSVEFRHNDPAMTGELFDKVSGVNPHPVHRGAFGHDRRPVDAPPEFKRDPKDTAPADDSGSASWLSTALERLSNWAQSDGDDERSFDDDETDDHEQPQEPEDYLADAGEENKPKQAQITTHTPQQAKNQVLNIAQPPSSKRRRVTARTLRGDPNQTRI